MCSIAVLYFASLALVWRACRTSQNTNDDLPSRNLDLKFVSYFAQGQVELADIRSIDNPLNRFPAVQISLANRTSFRAAFLACTLVSEVEVFLVHRWQT